MTISNHTPEKLVTPQNQQNTLKIRRLGSEF